MSDKSTVFRCLSCSEFISIDAERCRFCSATVDRQAAKTASEIQGTANAAYNEANHLKLIVITVFGLYVGINIYLLIKTGDLEREFLLTKKGDLVFITLAVLCALAIIVLILRIVLWRSKYGGFQPDNLDMKEAKAAARSAFFAWCALCVALTIFFLIPVLVRLM
jgi:hypothetical protein